ncbi:MAG: hypothetical protein HYX96_02085 [Chloroflexi bacterium]|nr:hypothetical protein [Chloroflexota bacterium]
MARKTRVALKYCGCCNPAVDLSRIAAHLVKEAGPGSYEMVSLTAGEVDVVVVLCGCPRACGDKAAVRAGAGRFIVVAGERVEGEPVPGDRLPEEVASRLVRMLAVIK